MYTHGDIALEGTGSFTTVHTDGDIALPGTGPFTTVHTHGDIALQGTGSFTTLYHITSLYKPEFSQPTYTHMYLHYGSCHPKHTKTGGPYSQLLQVWYICSRLSDFRRHGKEIIFNYGKRGYLAHLLEEKLQLVLRKDRHSLFHPAQVTVDDPEQDPLFCVVMYHPHNPPILDTLANNWKILLCTPTLKCIS